MNSSHYFTNTEYKRGIDDEITVKNWLKSLGCTIREVNEATNIQGIDCYVNGRASDIKSQKYKPYYKGFCFESMVFSRRKNRWLNDGWFNTGKANIYYYLVEREPNLFKLYEIEKQRVISYGFDYIKELSHSTKQQQKASTVDYINTISGYILYENIDAVGRVIGETDKLSRFMENTKRAITRPTPPTYRVLQDVPT
ncbi:hypothetical protein A4L_11 [Anabaena phage A-4L]|uniref:Uncharacterized protein n=1 Tax=Anabaena phage A-4L TaxID=1357732 RepID=A0A059PYD8_9CAUD|nr:hypothetical protein A4L_11 [Anabaena phage A-4L]AGR48538.1 hypothetical protein A4L_11 [Anabaena phage A-4L]